MYKQVLVCKNTDKELQTLVDRKKTC